MAKKLILAISLLWTFALSAQEALDTLELEPVEIQATRLNTYASGFKMREISESVKSQYSGMDLAELLQAETTVYLRNQGAPGQVSSISFRGTGAGHTAVYWNGININSMTLGLTDFSLVPVFAGDELRIMYGSGSAIFGTDAVGGSIHINSAGSKISGKALGFSYETGSYGLQRSRLEIQHGTTKWQHHTRFYHTRIKNDFKVHYRDSSYSQNNADILNIGVQHRSEFLIGPFSSLSINAWYNRMDRSLQPKIGDFRNEDELEDDNLRFLIDFDHHSNKWSLNLQTGYVYDQQVYNQLNAFGTQQWIAVAETGYSFFSVLNIEAGINFKHIQSDVESYLENISENRTDAFLSLFYRPVEKIELSLNFRKTMVKGFDAPLAPSLGSQIKLLDRSVHKLSWRGTLSKSYKIPTFNDRFWEPGGNPDLKPETGWAWDTGINYSNTQDNLRWESDLNYYELSIRDWILWIPQGSLWSPQNVRKVNTRGVEFLQNLKVNHGKYQFEAGGGLTYVRSVNVEGLNENDGTAGKLLPYTPEWNWNGFLGVRHGPWYGRVNTYFVGGRYTEQSNTTAPLPSYQLWDLSIAYSKVFGELHGKLYFSVQNLLDREYENFINRAMPGRNFRVGLLLQLNKSEKNEN